MDAFEALRPKLFALAYNMLGSVAEAEDVLQDAWLRFQHAAPEKLEHPHAYLRNTVTWLCLDLLKSAKVQREEYIGPWLPEPIITDLSLSGANPEQQISREETISLAFMTLMEQLSPLERAVFIMREIFDYEYADIANTLERSESACRKLFSRAKEHLTRHSQPVRQITQTQKPILESFLHAVLEGDIENLLDFLVEDVQLTSDGGGKVVAATRPIIGRDAVARFFVGLAKLRANDPQAYKVELTELNNAPGIIIRRAEDNIAETVFAFDFVDGKVRAIHTIRNPDKLKHLNG